MAPEPPSDPEALFEHLVEDGRSDGLPVIPPTEERLERALEHASRDRDEVLLEIPTTFADLTVESLASCAVMAGCRPEYVPVVEAAFSALAEWPNLQAVMATTGGFGVALVVNGPVREELDLNSSTGLFCPGNRANATIGRAVSLAFVAVGGVLPGEGTMATHGHQGRFTFCFGENEEATPWEPLHADRAGMDPGESAVTVVSAHAPHLLTEWSAADPHSTDEDVLAGLARGAGYSAHGPLGRPGELVFVLSQDHAGRLARDYGKDEVKAYLHEHCERPDGTGLLRSPDDALLVVAGGIGNYSSAIHGMNAAGNEAVTKPIRTD